MIAVVGYLIFAATYFVFAQAPTRSTLWIVIASDGLYYALTSPVLRALVVDMVQSRARGRALGIFYFATSVATLLASLLTGYLRRWKLHNHPIPLYLSAMLAVVAAGLLVLYSPKKLAA